LKMQRNLTVFRVRSTQTGQSVEATLESGCGFCVINSFYMINSVYVINIDATPGGGRVSAFRFYIPQ
jgi:hypothetical protein